MSKIKDLIEKRNKVWEIQKGINDKAVAEKRDLAPEEQTQWDTANTDFDALTDQINMAKDEEQRNADRVKAMELRAEEMKKSVYTPIKPDPVEEKRDKKTVAPRATEEYRDTFARYLQEGREGLSNVEFRALQADVDVKGGYTVVPEQFISELIKTKDNMVFIRRLARKFTLKTAASLGFPRLAGDPSDPTWTAEIRTGTEDSSMDFDKRLFYPHPLAKRIKVAEPLTRLTSIGIEPLVRERFEYVFSTVEEPAFLTGHGSNQPLGVMVQNDAGISTSRDIATDNTATAIKADNLIECKYTLKAQYRAGAVWIFHRDGVKRIRKLKDGEGNYLWKAGLTDKADTILEHPVYESEYQNSAFTANLLVGILGDFSQYWIVDCLDMRMQRLTELYAETNQIGFISRQELDGMPIDENAFVRVKMGA